MGGRMTRTGVRGLARHVALLVVVLAVLAGTAACTTAGGPGEPAATGGAAGVPAGLREAARATEAAGSARVESATTIGSAISLSAEGVLGWADGVTGTLTLTCTGGTMAGTLRLLGSTTMQARYLPDAYYARMGDAFAAQTGGRHWVRYAYDDLDSLTGGSGAQLGDQMRNSTPDRSLRLLLASGDVRRVGTERVRGERTTHYSGTVEAGDTAVTGQTVDVWIDERDLLVKKVEKGRTASGELVQTAYYGDYGAEADAERPPASDTRDFADLVGAGEGGGA
ncbi:Lipoprotein OS=Streptomyces glaucescens OX=1907 GN=SGLAU_20015 PE=4 SV=1 [Streptomyces glaucescens]